MKKRDREMYKCNFPLETPSFLSFRLFSDGIKRSEIKTRNDGSRGPPLLSTHLHGKVIIFSAH